MTLIKFHMAFILILSCFFTTAKGNQSYAKEEYLSEIIKTQIAEDVKFHGLASYYNNPNYFIIEGQSIQRFDESEEVKLNKSQWLAAVGRLKVLLVQAKGLTLSLENSTLKADGLNSLNPTEVTIKVVSKSELTSISKEFNQIRYVHLWKPLAWLARLVEFSLIKIQMYSTSNWGLTIIIFSILLKLILLPLAIITTRIQAQVSQVQTLLAPRLAEIKNQFDGEEAHNYLMNAHKELGVSPFYTLKPLFGSFIQIPILIAIFNALAEMPQLEGQSFLWIDNLIYPDSIGQLPLNIPMFGNTINLLPFVMTAVSILASTTFQNRFISESAIRRQKYNLYIMSLVFFILFYPFPAAMVLYWTSSNILQLIQQQFIKI